MCARMESAMKSLARTSPLIVVSMLAACGTLDDGAIDEVRLGIIDYHDRSDEVLELPGSASPGSAVPVVVRTYGGGCEEAHSMDVEVSDDLIVLTPHDRTYMPADGACIAILRRLEHEAVLEFDDPGVKTVRIVGRRVTARLDEEVHVDFELAIE
jgi:hypothetical protein